LVFFIDGSAVTTSTRIILFTVLISYLTTRFASSILTALFKPRIEVGSDQAFIELCTSNVFQAIEGVLVGVILDETEATGRLLKSVQTHDDALDLTTSEAD